jgi:hypothetical protein
MAFPIPRIIYGSTILDFTYPDVQKPMTDLLQAVRHDSITSSGLRQSMVERVDVLKTLQFDSIPWADLPAFSDFIKYAIEGGSFQFYPDATASAFQTWELVDDNFSPQFSSRGLTKCTLKLRQVPGGTSHL